MEEVWEFANCPDPSPSLRVRVELTDLRGTEETNSSDVEFHLPNDREWREQSAKEVMSTFNQQDWLNGELWRAAYEGDADYVKELISQGADPNSTDSTGMSALAIACQDGRTEVVKYLLGHGADVNGHCKGCVTDRTPLIAAASEGQVEILGLLVNHGADVNTRGELGWTALIWAAAGDGDVESVKFLLNKGADPNVKASDGKSVVELASDSEIIKLLKDARKVR
jgi:ankyrin repeat protein